MSHKNITDAAEAAVPAFDPVPVRIRLDGWTPERQRALIAALAIYGRVAKACSQLGLSTTSAYQLYNRHDAASFRDAWNRVLESHYRVRLAEATRGGRLKTRPLA